MLLANVQLSTFRDKLAHVVSRLNRVKVQIEQSHLIMEHKHKALFHQCVNAQEEKNSAVAMLFANECTKVRKMARVIIVSQLTLERLVFNLETVHDYHAVIAELKPTTSTLQFLSGRLSEFVPDASEQLKHIGQTLESIVFDINTDDLKL